MNLRHLLLCAILLALAGCSGTSTSSGSGAPGMTGAKSEFASEPPLEISQEALDANLLCTGYTHPDKPAVLLVHGTFTSGYEQYDWTYLPLLADRGYDVCTVTYPDRGFGDAQVSAEYVVNALRRMHAKTGRKVAMIGHSQGVMVPRWAIKWWPSARDAVEDFVMEAGPNHGINPVLITTSALLTSLGFSSAAGQPEVVYQFYSDSDFMKASNAGDETPGDIDYTALYTQFDELVQPASPIPTAAVDFGKNNPKVANLLLQDICPGRLVDHVTIGLTDRLAFELMLDAISNPGPANLERAGGAAKLCGLAAIIPDQIIAPEIVTGMVQVMMHESASSIPNPHLASAEPPLKAYVH
jgi:triacylglycerol lipase